MFNASARWESHHAVSISTNASTTMANAVIAVVVRKSTDEPLTVSSTIARHQRRCGDPQFTACENQSDRMPICTDIDECESLNGGCGDPASIRCINRIAAEPLCEDVNECRNGPEAAGCAENADCINVLGGFICQCRDGFNGDGLAGFGCRDADECAINNGGCDQLSSISPAHSPATVSKVSGCSGMDEHAQQSPPVRTVYVTRWRATLTVAAPIARHASSVHAAARRPTVQCPARVVRCCVMDSDVQRSASAVRAPGRA